eukprot:g12017.t1
MNASETPPEHWEVATEWRNGGTRATSKAGGGEIKQGDQQEVVVSLGLLRTCFSERYGSHIPRMFHDLVVDLGHAFSGAREAGSSDEHGTQPIPADVSEKVSGSDDGGRVAAPVFHVTEYDVIKGRYPKSWEDHAGYIIPGGVASACGSEPWMLTLLDEVKDLRDSGRPVLAFCLGHQVIAQALGGLVRPRTGSYRHYALQESELLVNSASASPSPSSLPALDAIVDAVLAVRRGKGDGGGGDGRGGGGGRENGVHSPPSLPLPLPPLKLLYHHNDEVVKLPPGATNISTSGRCEIHGMIMMSKVEGTAASPRAVSSSSASSSATRGPSTPSILTFQAHPELNYEYGRRVMNGILDGDVVLGRLTHDQAAKLKEQVLTWDHQEFPVAVELMRQLFAPIVPRSHGGELQ